MTNFFDALFTATSAVCVTGLTVVDTATHWSGFGQVVIMLLIQIGGLGIMISAGMIGLLLARKMSVAGRLTAAAEANAIGLDDVRGLLRSILLGSLRDRGGDVRAAGSALRARLRLRPRQSRLEQPLPTRCPSFNNAGFALYSDNLIGFAADPFICLPICAAIILGGLGFPVLRQLRKEFPHPLRWTMNTRLVLSVSIVLLLVGTRVHHRARVVESRAPSAPTTLRHEC